jgi:hypothetical protein
LNDLLHISPRYHPQARLAVRDTLRDEWDFVRSHVPTDKRIYIINQHTDGFEVFLAGYELAPRRRNPWGWSIGKPYSPADTWTIGLTCDEFRAQLAGYDYLYLASTDARFWTDYGRAFAPADRDGSVFLFEIDRSKGIDVALYPIRRNTTSIARPVKGRRIDTGRNPS